MIRLARTGCVALATTLALFACSDDSGFIPVGADSETDARGGGRRDAGEDTHTADDADAAGGDATSSDANGDTTATDAAADGTSTDAAGGDGSDRDTTGDTTNGDVDPDCDRDNDGFLAPECGGDDCDDDNLRVSPGAREVCDFVDNDCDGRVNEGINCSFFAHTSTELYEIDPFHNSIVFVTQVPRLLDFDTTTDGTLWGIATRTLYRFDPDAREWDEIASLAEWPIGPNGFAVDSRGQGYATAGSELYGIDLETGVWRLIGDMGGDFLSSGDCVVDKNDLLYMTSDHLDDEDVLVRLDASTGVATEIGPIGYRAVYGLTAAWGYLFGMTVSGQLIEIDIGTGEGRLLHTFEGKRWYGAASSATR